MLKAALLRRVYRPNLLLRSFSLHARRTQLWDGIQASQPAPTESQPINIQLPDQSIRKGQANSTTPLSVAQTISQGLARETVVANVNGILQDLNAPFKTNSSLSLLKFDSFHGQQTFWHSSAHILGQAIELFYGPLGFVYLSDGPSLVDHQSGGFFYDFLLPEGRTVDPTQLKEIEKICQQIIKEKQPFQKITVDRSTAVEMFSDNPVKLSIISRIDPSDPITLYRCGPFIDLCRGPHMQHTGMAKSFSLTSSAPVVGTLDGAPVQFQRIYGISFPDAKLLTEWQTKQAEALKRDHRTIGKQQNLFMFSALAPGSPFFLPSGTRIYNTLISFIKSQYFKRGYEEVITPLLYSNELWKMSGHWDHYREDMFFISNKEQTTQKDSTIISDKEQTTQKETILSDKEQTTQMESTGGHSHECNHTHPEFDAEMGLKPMNCPAHCLIFSSTQHSWRDLPIRYADFSPLHRNESSGALRGLTRLRRFVQDDAHIFCQKDQISSVISECLDFVATVYSTLGFTYRVMLSTRPESYMGELQLWETAESELHHALQKQGIEYTINPGDGAFYGPKIDIMARDALGREHQCGTVQLDFQLPLRFNLSFQNRNSNPETPVLVHRAMLGSVERMMAILIEHNSGKWPFWLNPKQIILCSVSMDCEEYILELSEKIKNAGFFVDVNLDGETIQNKIRRAQMAQYNFILVVGKKEKEEGVVNVRTRDNQVQGAKKVDDLIEEWEKLKVGMK